MGYSPTGQLAFVDFFRSATGTNPFPFQQYFAVAEPLPALVDVPTGLGKTAMAVLGWLWRRRFADEGVRRATPRRLVYCLPLRVLVEQVRDSAVRWLNRFSLLAGAAEFEDDRRLFYEPPRLCDLRRDDPSKIAVYVLMGGEDEPEWDTHPERDAVIIGTQDMLLSRALNRGYAASRARWPRQFGLLNTDCLWIFDEIQLMGSGLATTAQLEAFRRSLGGWGVPRGDRCASVWMSATLRPDWLRTVDFKDRIDDQGRIDGRATLSLSAEDHRNTEIAARWNARKPLSKVAAVIDEKHAADLARAVSEAHKPGTRTIVVVNTVKRACALHEALSKTVSAETVREDRVRKARGAAASAATTAGMPSSRPKLVLLHSRFRPPDRMKHIAEALADVDVDGPGTIIVSTQVIEAGVDVSAATLFTELAPWPSLVQRFGRCNRRGEQNEVASVHWIDLPAENIDAEKVRHPYELADLRAAADELETLNDVGLASLAAHRQRLSDERQSALFPHRHAHVIRHKDLLDLFDTTPDLAGSDIDIDRYVREIDETDVRVFWRNYGDPDPKNQGATPNDINGEGRAGGRLRVEPAPLRDELCPAPLGEFKAFAKREENRGRVWRWNFTERAWEQPEPESIAPGQVFLIHLKAGGYSAVLGWSGRSEDKPSPNHASMHAGSDEYEGYDDDVESQTGVWQTIADHTQDVCSELDNLVKSLELPAGTAAALRPAARWHDWGKAHEVFQSAVESEGRPAEFTSLRTIAKAPKGFWSPCRRRHFRHELASALAVLQCPHDSLRALPEEDLNLIAYLIAAHHGKVRLSIRSMPNEDRPLPRIHTVDGVERERRFARGVWDGDELPSVDLGGGVVAPAVTLSLEAMELGLGEGVPLKCFKDQPSWVERVLRVRDRFGPFRLAYLEAILRAADARASAKAAGNAQPPADAEAAEVSHA